MIPFAMGLGAPIGVRLSPMVGGMMMSASSVSVVVSSLWLKRYRRPVYCEEVGEEWVGDEGEGLLDGGENVEMKALQLGGGLFSGITGNNTSGYARLEEGL
jgi:Cu+-exporting ATPase